MAVPVARVHLKVAHAALPALLPTPPKWMMLPQLPTTTPCVAAIAPNPLAKPGRADAAERWDALKTKPAGAEHTADNVRSSAAGHGSSPRKNAISPAHKPGRADSLERWDAHKKATILASSPPSSSGMSSLVNSTCKVSRASSSERWDVHKKRCPPQAEVLDVSESSSIGSNSNDMDTEEEIVWKPRAMYAGPGFVAAAPEPSMLRVPTAFLVRVA